MNAPLAADLTSLVLPDLHGVERRLSDFWKTDTAVFVFLRHYG